MTNNLSTPRKDSVLMEENQTAKPQRKRKGTTFAALALAGIAVASLTGCLAGKYTGGGFIDSTA